MKKTIKQVMTILLIINLVFSMIFTASASEIQGNKTEISEIYSNEDSSVETETTSNFDEISEVTETIFDDEKSAEQPDENSKTDEHSSMVEVTENVSSEISVKSNPEIGENKNEIVLNAESQSDISSEVVVLAQLMEMRGIGGKGSYEIVYDYNDDPEFILGITESGWLMMRRLDGFCLEYGEGEGPYYDYEIGVKKYYGGFMLYSVPMNNQYYNIAYDTVVSEVPYMQTLETIPEGEIILEGKDEFVMDANSQKSLFGIIPEKDVLTSKKARVNYIFSICVPNYYEYIQRKAFGKNEDGTCSAVALGIALNYLDRQIDTRFVPEKYESENLKSNRVGVDTHPKAEMLHQHLYRDGGLGTFLVGEQVNNALYTYKSYNGEVLNMELTTHWTSGDTTDKVRKEINNGKPAIISTPLSGATTVDGGNFNKHVAVAYGYRLNSLGVTEFLVHSGWDGANIELIGNSPRIKEHWLSEYYIVSAGSFQYTKTPINGHPILNFVTANGRTSYTLNWTDVPNTEYYKIYRKTSSSAGYECIANVDAKKGFTYIDMNAPEGQRCYYRVRATKRVFKLGNGLGPYNEYSSAYSNIESALYLSTPEISIKLINQKPVVSWSSIPGASKYELVRSVSGESTYTLIYSGAEKTYTDTSLTVNNTYTYNYKVRAYSDGVFSEYSLGTNGDGIIGSWTYSIKYDANGGKGAPESQIKDYSIDLTLSDVEPTRTGYTFLGWAESSSDKTAAYSAGGKYTADKGTITLYAIWKSDTYTVTYNANKGGGAPLEQQKKNGINLTLSIEVPVCAGYEFQGWATNSSAKVVVYNPGAVYSKNENLRLYAVWKKNIYYRVYYVSNGGTGVLPAQTKLHGLHLVLNRDNLTRSGYIFQGWAEKSTATTATYSAGGIYDKDKSITLYAVWKKTNYRVKYNGNGGFRIPDEQEKTPNVSLKLSSVIPGRLGYTFVGWGLTSSAKVSAYSAGSTYTNNSDINLYAIWEKTIYTVTYKANRGNDAPPMQKKEYDYDIYLTKAKPKRAGHEFVGWSTNSNAATATYFAGSKYSANANITLYAIWEPDTYDVTYNANGGNGAPVKQKKTYAVTLILGSKNPTRTGYTFTGWSSSDKATVPTYKAGGSYTTNAKITLYAVWKPNTYKVTYNANGGTRAPGIQTKTHGVSLKLSSTEPTRTGYTFQGWAVSPGKSILPLFKPGGNYILNTGVTLYASWKEATYAIKYDANKGSGAPGAQTKKYGISLKLSSKQPTRIGYTFLGWSTLSSASAASFPLGSSYSVDKDMIFYAVWRANTYKITYSANGGTGAPGQQTKTHGVTLKISSTIPTRTGYKFLGWSAYPGMALILCNAGGNYTNNSEITLHAVWEERTYEMKYDANKGTGAPKGQTKRYGVTLRLTDARPNRAGHTFLGWSTSSAATVPGYQPKSNYTTNISKTLYAVWKADTYAVTYNANKGAGQPSTQTKTHGITLGLNTKRPTRAGHTFVGWATTSGATTAAYNPGGNFNVNAKTTLHAVWKADTYAIKYNANKGTGIPMAQTKVYGTTLKLRTVKPTRTGYIFLGWSTSTSATAATYVAGGNYNSNIGTTLYAVWKISTYTVEFNANGGANAPQSQKKTYGSTLRLTNSIPKRVGHTFLGWATRSSATTPDYKSGGNYGTNAGMTLYAVWRKNTYKILYNANGGSGAPSSQTKTYGASLKLTGIKPRKSGYTFVGWATSSKVTVAGYKAGSYYGVNAGATLYAVWKR